MIYYRGKYCKLFEEDSNESNNINIDNSSENDNDNIQLKTIDITSRDIKNNFQDLLKLSKVKQNSVISIAKQRFEDKLDNDTEDKISSEVTTIQNTQSVQKLEDNVIQNVMSSIGEIKDILSMLHKNAQTQSDELKNIKDTQDDIKSNQRTIKDTQDDIKSNQIKQHSDLQDIQYNQIRNQQQNQNTLDRMEYNQNKHNRKLDLIRQRQDPDINIIN